LAIYRGAGGAGDAVSDSNSEVLLALEAKDAAVAAQIAAETARTGAQSARTAAELAETNAETAETNAETAETNAASSASSASTSATNASNSASAASTSATNASNSASSASTSATNASNSASAASTSASNASTSASNASTSATAASAAQVAAETARDQTLTAYDNFDDRYLGAKSSAPTLDNDGNALIAGALYFNSTGGLMKVYTGSVWVDAYADGNSFLAKANNLSDLASTSTARTNLGATTVGSNLFTLTNPSAITFPRLNADNTVSALSDSAFRTAIGAGTGSGTVTSVTGTSPVSSSGGTTPAISLASGYGDTQNPYASKTANFVLAAPNGSAGVPTFRAVVAADIPTLNQNTTGTASNVTGTVAIANGGTGATTLAGANIPVTNVANTFTGLQNFAGTSSNADLKTSNILEVATISATAATGTIQYDVTTQSVLYYTTNASGNFTVNFRGSSGTSLNTIMATGESISTTFLVTNGTTAYYNSAVTIDGNSITPKWQGGSAPTSGNASSIDSYTYVILKTGSAAFTVLASVTRFA